MKQIFAGGGGKSEQVFFAYPLPAKGAFRVIRKVLDLMLTIGVPLSIRPDAGGEFTAQVVPSLCKWLGVSLGHGPADHPRTQGGVEQMGAWTRRSPACWI